MQKKLVTIQETQNIIDDHLLDIIGNEFKFDHSKGLAEWLKNSIDAYRTGGFRQDEHCVLFRFTDQGVPHPVIECIDFVGMSALDIEKAFKRWGDPTAAKRGKTTKVYGGHGNGGKFYMRQMFVESHFLTYKDGLLNIFGFSENKKYGYAVGFENKQNDPKEAMMYADIFNLPIPSELKEKVLAGETGFTVIRGIYPEGIKNRFRIAKEVERFKNHPQSRRILERSTVIIIYNGDVLCNPLKPDDLQPLAGFETPRIISIPETLATHSGSEKVTVRMANEKYPAGRLILKTSAEPLARGSKLGELNRIDILGEIGVIGSYQLSEIFVTGFPDAAFIFGEFGPAQEGDVSILEDPGNDCVSNDRSKLVSNDTTRALLEWIAKEVDKLAAEITAIKREQQKVSQKEITSKFNDVLNAWKNKHMSKIISDLFGGQGNAGKSSEDGTRLGATVTTPRNGFDFKYPQAEIQLDTPSKITLKVAIPQALPIGATVFFSSDTEKVVLSEQKLVIKSDNIKQTAEGENIAFLELEVVGREIDIVAKIDATAGKLSATTIVKVVPKKDGGSGKSFPRVLLSSHDVDPLGIAASGYLVLGDREPVVYQRIQDVAANIYWINTSSPMASKIYDKFTFDSIQWRNFLFERYIDIFIKEAIRELEKKENETFNADSVDHKISEVIRRVHQSANEDLEQFLFDESYVAQNV